VSDFYKMDPGAWDHGTANLSLEEEAAYLRIVNAIHKNKSPVPDNERVWAGLFRCSTRKARALVRALIDAGKLALTDDGLVNERAISDLVRRGFVSVSRAESGAKGGRTRAEKAAKALKNKEPPQAIASTREEKRREEYSDTNVSDLASVIFSQGLSLLVRQGVPEKQARSILGKWRQQHGDPALVDAIGRAQREGAVNAVEFIPGCFRRQKKRDAPAIGETRVLPSGQTEEWIGGTEGWVRVHA